MIKNRSQTRKLRLTSPGQDNVFRGDGRKDLRQFLHEVRVAGGDLLVEREAADLNRLLLPAPPVEESLHCERHGWLFGLSGHVVSMTARCQIAAFY